jgi:hypothetical protein
MIYMTRYSYIILIFLTSCSLIETRDIPAVARSFFLGPPDFKIAISTYEEMPYSFAKVKIGRSGAGVMVLLSINDGIYEWVGSNSEKIFTKNGKIIKTIGLDYNINILNYDDAELKCDECNSQYYIELSNPEALITQHSHIVYSHLEDIELLKTISSFVIIEKFSTSKFKWAGENSYWFNNSGQAIKANQEIHPNLGKVEITFYYK